MIDTINIQGFKSIAHAELSLGRLNVFVGANGAGKSNVLEAIGLLGCAVSGRVGEEAFRYRGVRPGAPALFKSAFKEGRIPRLISLVARAGKDQYRVALDNPLARPEALWRFSAEVLESDGWRNAGRSPNGATFYSTKGERITSAAPEKYQGIIPLVRSLRGDDPAGALLRALESYAIYTPFTPMLRGVAAEPNPRDPVGLSGGGLAGAFRDLHLRDKARWNQLLQEVLPFIDWASDITVASSEGPTGRALRFRDPNMRTGRDVLSAADASEGALYVLFLMMLLLHPSAPTFFAVDNIDSALHPSLARALVARVSEMLTEEGLDRQIIVTTHNPLVLDALRLSDPGVRLFIVSREKGTGFTLVRRVEHSDALERARAKGRTMSQLWVEGTFGGVPDLM